MPTRRPWPILLYQRLLWCPPPKMSFFPRTVFGCGRHPGKLRGTGGGERTHVAQCRTKLLQSLTILLCDPRWRRFTSNTTMFLPAGSNGRRSCSSRVAVVAVTVVVVAVVVAVAAAAVVAVTVVVVAVVVAVAAAAVVLVATAVVVVAVALWYQQ